MTIQSEINRINTGVQQVYNVLNDKKATMPQTRNLNNLVAVGETLPDFTAMGNELRKAKCYTYSQRGAGKIIFASPSKMSSPIDFQTFKGIQGWFGYFILDGKRYQCSYPDDSSDFVMTQQGTYGDCVDFCNDFRNVDGKLYYKDALIDDYANFKCSYWYTSDQGPSSFYFINNGKLYRYYSYNSPAVTVYDDTGEWTDFIGSSYGIKDGMLYQIYNLTQKLDIVVNPKLITSSYYAIDNKIYNISNKSLAYTFSKNIDTLYGNNYWVKLEDGKICILGNENVYIDKDVKRIFWTTFSNYTPSGSSDGTRILTEDGHLYNVSKSSSKVTTTEFITDTIGPVSDILLDIDSRFPFMSGYIPLLTSEDTEYKQHKFVAIEDSNKCYTNVNLPSSVQTITDKTNASITVNNRVYQRNAGNDSTFTFIPTELRNHTFNDQEMCISYLTAGVSSSGNPIVKFNASIDNFIGNIDANGVLSSPTNLSGGMDFSGVTTINANALKGMFEYKNIVSGPVLFPNLIQIMSSGLDSAFENNSITSVSMPLLTTVGYYGLNRCFRNNNITSVDLHSLTTITGSGALEEAFAYNRISTLDLSSLISICDDGLFGTFEGNPLTSVDLSSLVSVGDCGLRDTFEDTNLTTVSFPSLTTVYRGGFDCTFRDCSNLQSLYFPALQANNVNDRAFEMMLMSCSNVTVHFPSNLESVMSEWDDVTRGFDGTNTTILFDLDPTE